LIFVAGRALVEAEVMIVELTSYLLEPTVAVWALDVVGKRHLNVVRLFGMEPIEGFDVVVVGIASKLF